MANTEIITISAVIPAYNAERYIARSLDSVLTQTRPVDEIVVVDDGSTDGTAAIIKNYGEKVRYIYQENAGVSAARNAGIEAATCDWIAFLDADDEWLPEKIKRQVENLQNNPDLVWTTANYVDCLCDEKRRAEHTPVSQCLNYQKDLDYYDSYFEAIQLYQWGHTDCMLIHKKLFEEVGVFNTDLQIAEDIDVWLRIAYRNPKVGFLSEPLAVHHLSSENSLMKKKRGPGLYLSFVERHMVFAKNEEMIDEFEPAAAFMMRRWIRGMLFSGRKVEIRELLTRFPESFTAGYRVAVYGLTIFPSLTVWGLRLMSTVVRTLKLRRRVTRRPPRGAN